MEGNREEAARCVEIAKSALASGDKQRALKFIRIARRLDRSLPLDDLADCEELDDSAARNREEVVGQRHEGPSCTITAEASNGGRNYTEDHVRQIRQIKMTKDFYAILGVKKNSSVEEIRKAYKKLSLKVHPDKNKAPGAEEAFKSVCKAFECLSDEQSRQHYDRTGPAEAYAFNPLNVNTRRRRRRTAARNEFFGEDFDPDEIFRSFFDTPGDVFHARRDHRSRGMGRDFREHNVHRGGVGGGDGGISLLVLVQILPILLFLLIAYFPLPEPQYSLQKTRVYLIPKVTEKHGVEYYVKSGDFEQQFPQGSSLRDTLERNVLRDYKSVLHRYCHMELQRRQWVKTSPRTHCDKLRSLQVS